MNPHEVQPYLDSFINHELNLKAIPSSEFKLTRMEHLLDLLSRPQEATRCIHVAGTKGKGSTCAFVAHILKSAGYRVGLYTSPHINDFRERIRVLENSARGPGPSGRRELFPDCIRDGELCSLLSEMKPALEVLRHTAEYGRLSYFEVLTALAFCTFRQRRVDFAVLETGLGGRLDATNVVEALAYGITSISLEHTQQLGGTLKLIAAEKAAVIKKIKCFAVHEFAGAGHGEARMRTREANSSAAVVVAPQAQEALEVIEARCRQQGVKEVTLVGRDITFKRGFQDVTGQAFEVRGILGRYDLKTKLLGSHQITNAAVAVGLVESLEHHGISIPPAAIEQGIRQTEWPGRFEILRQKPYVVLDAAHNPESCEKMAETVRGIFPGKKIILILGLSDDKNRRQICRNLEAISSEIILTAASHPRAWRFTGDAAAQMFKGRKCVRTNTVREALDTALEKATDDDVVLVTGSIFVVGQARKICTN